MTDKDTRRLDKLDKKAGSALGRRLDSLGTVVERGTRSKVQAILDSVSHPLHNTLTGQRSRRSQQLISL